jgi:hypothetical protein
VHWPAVDFDRHLLNRLVDRDDNGSLGSGGERQRAGGESGERETMTRHVQFFSSQRSGCCRLTTLYGGICFKPEFRWPRILNDTNVMAAVLGPE